MAINASDMNGKIGGAAGALLGEIITRIETGSWISLSDLGRTIVLAIVGAIVGHLTSRAIKWITKKLKRA